MKYTVKSNRLNAILFCITLLIASILFMALSFLTDNFLSDISKSFSAIFFMLSIIITSKYLTFVYTYTIDGNEFIITQTSKFVSKTVCRLYISDIVKIQETKRIANFYNNQYNEKYNYCSTLFCKESYTIKYNSGDGYGIIIFEPDKRFVNELEKYINCNITLS